jgi:hypothetical protein
MKEPQIIRVRRSALSRVIKANHELEDYCTLHPGSPVAVRRPRISIRKGMWVAALGNSSTEEIVASGKNVSAALEAFDRQYLAALRPEPQVQRPAA